MTFRMDFNGFGSQSGAKTLQKTNNPLRKVFANMSAKNTDFLMISGTVLVKKSIQICGEKNEVGNRGEKKHARKIEKRGKLHTRGQ